MKLSASEENFVSRIGLIRILMRYSFRRILSVSKFAANVCIINLKHLTVLKQSRVTVFDVGFGLYKQL